VIGSFEADDYQGLILEFVESKSKTDCYWKNLGDGLADLHKKTNTKFGLDHSNYIGSLPQYNDWSTSWIDFFIDMRLSVQLKLAVDNNQFPREIIGAFERLYKLLPSLLPVEKPSLIHGDLWSGNVIDHLDEPCLIDPAVHYGNRESEIAFTQLFGGFDESFYRSYNESFKLQDGFQRRVDIYNLYPLLVHVNLFGGGYARQVRGILGRYT
jgi:fructosamine-3-kinase